MPETIFAHALSQADIRVIAKGAMTYIKNSEENLKTFTRILAELQEQCNHPGVSAAEPTKCRDCGATLTVQLSEGHR
jgi:hypothetical protein